MSIESLYNEIENQIDLWLPIAHQTQQKVLDCDARFIVLMCGRRWGKSVISQSLAIENALHGKLVAYITPTYGLAKIFYEEIGNRLDAVIVALAEIEPLKSRTLVLIISMVAFAVILALAD